MKSGNVALADNHQAESGTSPLDVSVLEGLEIGMAAFDSQLRLVHANTRYAEYCGYAPDQVKPGVSLRELIHVSLDDQGWSKTQIQNGIENAIDRLSAGPHKFHFKPNTGITITVHRNMQPDGGLVETVFRAASHEVADIHQSRLQLLAKLSHDRMMQALDAIGDGFALYDSQDRLVVYNEEYVKLNPHIADLITPGARYEDMLRQGIARGGIKAGDLSEEELVQRELDAHRNPGLPYDRQLSDGRWIRIIEKATADGGIAGIRSDISELKERELEVSRISLELSETSNQFETALNNMVQGLCMFDRDQKLILCNRQYLDMYGFSSDVVKPGIFLADIMKYSISLGNYHDADAEAALKTRHNPDRLKKRTVIKQYLRDGRVIAVMNEPMSNGGTIATYQDITKLERHEERLIAYNRKLAQSNKELQEFAYVASHDLQEPLRKIEAFGDRLARKYGDVIPDEGKVFIDRMQNAAFRMRHLINDLLSYSRVTTKAKPFEPIELQEVLDGVLSDMQIRIQESNAEVISEGLPKIDADPVQMRQLLQNLLSNALKFQKPDVKPKVVISAEPFDQEGPTRQLLPYWRIRIADNGIGFDNKYKDQIFTIFQRLHGRLEYEGTGIGLATCRKIIERHNGTIDADGELDVGATFILELPERQEQKEDE